MSCQILTEERLHALVRGGLSPEGRKLLRDHLGGPCPGCLSRLEALDDDGLLGDLGVATPLSVAEDERLFADIVTRARRPSPARRRWLAPAVGLAAAAAALVFAPRGAAPPSDTAPPAAVRYDRIKGEAAQAPAEIHLAGYAARLEDGRRVVSGRLADGQTLRVGDRLIFRCRLSRSAFVYLVGVREGGAAEVLLAPTDAEAPWPGGERELAAAGQVLALDPAQLSGSGASVRLLAVASPRRLTSAEVAAAPVGCAGCTVDGFTVVLARAAP